MEVVDNQQDAENRVSDFCHPIFFKSFSIRQFHRTPLWAKRGVDGGERAVAMARWLCECHDSDAGAAAANVLIGNGGNTGDGAEVLLDFLT